MLLAAGTAAICESRPPNASSPSVGNFSAGQMQVQQHGPCRTNLEDMGKTIERLLGQTPIGQ